MLNSILKLFQNIERTKWSHNILKTLSQFDSSITCIQQLSQNVKNAVNYPQLHVIMAHAQIQVGAVLMRSSGDIATLRQPCTLCLPLQSTIRSLSFQG